MIKNIVLKQIEADFLREQITQRIANETGESAKFTTYLNGYGQLNDSIKKSLLEAEEFTSENLLRKLLSESVGNEEVTFRVGFLDACYRYITEGKHNRASYLSKDKKSEEPLVNLKNRSWIFIALTSILLTGIGSSIYYFSKKDPSPFIEEFDNLELNHLKSKGWSVMTYNDSLWKNQIRAGHLTLWTVEKDIWIQTLKPEIDNLIYRKTDCDCFEVVLKVDDFKPLDRWQQYGLVFFEDPDRIANFLRYDRAFSTNTIADTTHEVTDIVEVNNRFPVQLQVLNFRRLTSETLKEVWLRVLVRHHLYSFSLRVGHEGVGFRDAYSFNERYFQTRPKYVGIIAMQGYKSDLKDKSAQLIPVLVDKFIINPIACE